jgi:hypothetical protein
MNYGAKHEQGNHLLLAADDSCMQQHSQGNALDGHHILLYSAGCKHPCKLAAVVMLT